MEAEFEKGREMAISGHKIMKHLSNKALLILACVYTCICARAYVHIYVYSCEYMHAHAQTCVYMHILYTLPYWISVAELA